MVGRGGKWDPADRVMSGGTRRPGTRRYNFKSTFFQEEERNEEKEMNTLSQGQ